MYLLDVLESSDLSCVICLHAVHLCTEAPLSMYAELAVEDPLHWLACDMYMVPVTCAAAGRHACSVSGHIVSLR
jgi:hypothetical protein